LNLEKAIGFRAKDARVAKTELYEVGETLNPNSEAFSENNTQFGAGSGVFVAAPLSRGGDVDLSLLPLVLRSTRHPGGDRAPQPQQTATSEFGLKGSPTR